MRKAVRELPDGYEFQFPSDPKSIAMVAEWAAGERLCCPFFNIQLRMEAEGGPFWLRVTGRKGTTVMLNAILFVMGFSAVFLALGALATTIGQLIRQHDRRSKSGARSPTWKPTLIAPLCLAWLVLRLYAVVRNHAAAPAITVIAAIREELMRTSLSSIA
jgi:hypothetical protein